MKYFFIIIFLVSPIACSADSGDRKTVSDLLDYFTLQNKGTNSVFRKGDFNGDGLEDFAVLVRPKAKLVNTEQVRILTPWKYLNNKSEKYTTSLVIFHKKGKIWNPEKTEAFIFLDSTGTLETPSFDFLVSRNGSKDYKETVKMLPIKIQNDIIILPTEAGIDTYIYWDKGTYKLFIPDEIP